jgi:putative spermidine/putrescine transport system substrate-binding protein
MSRWAASFEAAVLRSINRREFLLGALGAAAAMPSMLAEAQSASLPVITQFRPSMSGTGTVRIASSGGIFAAALKKALFEPFETLSGIKVVSADGYSTAQVKSQVDAKSVQWDVLSLEYSSIADLTRQGAYFEPLDYSLIDTDGFGAEQVHATSLGYVVVATIIAYRTDAFGGKTPNGYKDFWDLTRFQGPRNWMSGTLGICPFLEGALLADGVSRDQLYPLDVPRALRSLTRIRDAIVTVNGHQRDRPRHRLERTHQPANRAGIARANSVERRDVPRRRLGHPQRGGQPGKRDEIHRFRKFAAIASSPQHVGRLRFYQPACRRVHAR